MVVFPNIKINIGLSITAKRPDGYHNIETIMVPVPWRESLEVCDRSEIMPEPAFVTGIGNRGKARIYLYGNHVPGNADENLCLRVYAMLEKWFNLPVVDIHLLKALPIGAGLGAGSADAAFCLRSLKDFFGLRISDVEARELLAQIGSDCPFFWDNRPALAFGRGEHVRPIDLSLSGQWAMLVYPNLAISTKEAYAGVVPEAPIFDLSLLPSMPFESWKEVVKNDFETSLFSKHSILSDIKSKLYEMGAFYASMSGSGSTMYGLFHAQPSLPHEWSHFVTWVGKIPD